MTDFEALLAEWNSIFLNSVDPTRARRMEAILAVLATRLQPPIRVFDLGAGPGPLAARILERIEDSRVLGVDSDPVLLRVGELALSRYGSRIAWQLADLRGQHWSSGAPSESVDGVVSSLALHWLKQREIRGIYQATWKLLRPGGLVINGDFLPSRPGTEKIGHPQTRTAGAPRTVREAIRVREFKSKWARWWAALASEPGMHPYFEERQKYMPGPIPPRRDSGPSVPVSVESHVRGLRSAGFRQVELVWRERGFCVLVGVK